MDQSLKRRDFIKINGLAGAGLILGFSFYGCKSPLDVRPEATAWADMNAFLTIADNGVVTIMSPNPEIGQGVKTSMPMIIAEELDVDWKDVVVKQAPFDEVKFTRQVAGGSQSIRKGWISLRNTGATAREMLKSAAAEKWQVKAADCSTENGMVIGPDGQKLSYGELAEAASSQEVPTEVTFKKPADYKIIGQSKNNVDLPGIIQGKPLFGMDFKREGMVYANVIKGPFGASLKSFNADKTKQIEGVQDVIKFGEKLAVIGNNTWACFSGKNALEIEWEKGSTSLSTEVISQELRSMLEKKPREYKREDGNVDKAFNEADEVIERYFEAPFLAHNTMAPMNFFAHVTADKVECVGPIQTPAWTQGRIATLLDRPKEQVTIDMTRMGGGFGRRLYGDFALEAAEISSIINKPVKVVYQREDDMAGGIYRPASQYKFRAALKDNAITAYEVIGASVNDGNCVRANNFPAGAIENYRVSAQELKSDITCGAWRAPVTNFIAFAEQSFLDEVAEKLKISPIDFRLELLAKAKAAKESNPALEYDYDADRMAGVINDVVKNSDYGSSNKHHGLSSYYSHNTYVAEVAVIDKELPGKIEKMYCSIDCGIVINPGGAINQAQGGVIDGMGHAMYGELTIKDGVADQNNFHNYRMIRMSEVPDVEINFIESEIDPTGLGEPTLPPAGGAVANALYKATGQRIYKQPFQKELDKMNKLG